MTVAGPSPPDDEFAVEQYRALRAEIIQSMDDGNAIMAFGLAALGLALTAAVQARESSYGFMLFGVVLPLLAALILSMWFSAQERTARASYFLTGIERRFSPATPTGHLEKGWEHWLRFGDDGATTSHFWSTEQAAIALFVLMATTSLGFSANAGGDDVSGSAKLIMIFVVVLIGIAFGASLRRRYRRQRSWLSDSRVPPTP